LLIAISGTPGTGKTSVSAELRSRGYKVVDANEHLRSHGLLGEKDEARDTYNVDMEAFNSSLEEFRRSPDTVFIDSHLSHQCDCSRIIVLRCHPDVLAERLRARGYSEAKVRENVQAEVLDVILCEATDTDIPVNEIDCTAKDVKQVANLILEALDGGDICRPGSVDWSQGMEEWF
jgi:adenylate kinase